MKLSALSFLTIALALLPLHADVKLPAIFGDHMVLQQGKTLPVWGTATPGEKVTVTIGADHASTTAGADGAWRVDLQPLPVNATGTTLTVAGTNQVTCTDVLVGDVWLASGQSNMERNMGAFLNRPNVVDINKVVAEATNPQIRIFLVQRKPSYEPQSDVSAHWQVCSPDVVKGSSAVAYFFAQALQQKYQRPIGLLDSYWGGMPIRAFTSLEAVEAIPEMKGVIAKSAAASAAWLGMSPEARAAAMADYKTKLEAWNRDLGDPYKAALVQWQKDAAAAKAANQPAPPRPPEPMPRAPASPEGSSDEAGNIFNGMIHPLIPFAIEGALWYQGETDATNTADLYGKELATMITDWRGKWNEGDFPFLVVGLANFRARTPEPVDETWPRVREGQFKATQNLPNVALAEAIDVGQAGDIHPVDKYDVGRRLAAAAEHVAYGEKDPWSGPTYAGETIQGNSVRIKFDHTDGGLVIAASPWPADNAPEPTDHLVGFAVAGTDQKWVWADAKIDGDSVVVSSPQVPAPVAVRFAWANNPALNLYNKAGFPAVPFRTDNWPLVVTPPKPASPPAAP
jgi:sialate O-acetylesterase